VLKENLPLPDLVLIDGGKGQVSAALDVLENELGLDVPVAGLVKDDKHRTSNLLIGDPLEIVQLERNSQEFYLLQRIRMKFTGLRSASTGSSEEKAHFNRCSTAYRASANSGKNCC
jgi:hypothetical protein